MMKISLVVLLVVVTMFCSAQSRSYNYPVTEKITGENFLRVFEAVEKKAKQL